MSENNSVQSLTTIGPYSLAMQKALEANGYDAKDLFAAAGIDHAPSNNPLERLTTAQVAWQGRAPLATKSSTGKAFIPKSLSTLPTVKFAWTALP